MLTPKSSKIHEFFTGSLPKLARIGSQSCRCHFCIIHNEIFRWKKIWKKIIFFAEKFDFENVGSKKIRTFSTKKFSRKNLRKSQWKIENFEISKFSIFHWLFRRFFSKCFWSQNIFFSRFEILKMNEKILFFIQVFFSYKVWLCTIQKCPLPL